MEAQPATRRKGGVQARQQLPVTKGSTKNVLGLSSVQLACSSQRQWGHREAQTGCQVSHSVQGGALGSYA